MRTIAINLQYRNHTSCTWVSVLVVNLYIWRKQIKKKRLKYMNELCLSLAYTQCSHLKCCKTHKTKRKTSKRHALQPTQLNAFSNFHHMSPWEEFSSYATQFCFARLWVWLCNTGNKEFDTYLNGVPSSGCFYEGFKRNTFKCKSMYFISAAYLYCNYFC